MFFLKKIGCRVFQLAFRAVLPFLPYREPQVIDSCKALGPVLQKEQLRSALVVTDGGIVKNRLLAPPEAVLKENGITYTLPPHLTATTGMDALTHAVIPQMAEHAEKEANPLYPVPRLMTKKELEKFYYKIADWSEEK